MQLKIKYTQMGLFSEKLFARFFWQHFIKILRLPLAEVNQIMLYLSIMIGPIMCALSLICNPKKITGDNPLDESIRTTLLDKYKI